MATVLGEITLVHSSGLALRQSVEAPVDYGTLRSARPLELWTLGLDVQALVAQFGAPVDFWWSVTVQSEPILTPIPEPFLLLGAAVAALVAFVGRRRRP